MNANDSKNSLKLLIVLLLIELSVISALSEPISPTPSPYKLGGETRRNDAAENRGATTTITRPTMSATPPPENQSRSPSAGQKKDSSDSTQVSKSPFPTVTSTASPKKKESKAAPSIEKEKQPQPTTSPKPQASERPK
jgi:hypothetical protein